MAKLYSIRVEGQKELIVSIKNLNRDVIDELRKACNQGAKLISDKASQLAPKGPGKPAKGYFGGRLKRSLVYREMPYKETSPIVSIAAVDRKVAPHAHLVEFGTSKARPHPFFRPAYRAAAGKVKEILTAAMKRAVLKAGRL